MDAATGSTTNGVGPSAPMPTRSQASAIALMIADVASMPVFAASSPMSVATASICAATVSGGSVCTPVTPSVFCTVTAVTARHPCTPQAVSARRSAAMPAPPPESVPAIVMTRGGVLVVIGPPASVDGKPARLDVHGGNTSAPWLVIPAWR